MRTRGPLIIILSKTKHKYGSDKEIRKKLVEHTPHRVTFPGCVRVFDGGWVTKQQRCYIFPKPLVLVLVLVLVLLSLYILSK